MFSLGEGRKSLEGTVGGHTEDASNSRSWASRED